MAVRRSLVRSWRRLRRPTLLRLVWVSLVLHLAVGMGVLAWLTRESSQAPVPSRAPLIVELPPAEPGPPLVRPEAPPSQGSAARSVPPAARPAPAPRPLPPAPPSVAKLPEPPLQPTPPSPPPAASPAPPVVARAPEPAPPSPEPAAAPPAAPPPGPPATPTTPIEPSPPAVAPRPPEPAAGATGPARPAPPVPPADPSESPLAGRRFSLLTPKLEVPPLPGPSGRGGTLPEGAGAGESGTEREGQIAVPLNTPDPRYAAYFAELKRRIEEKWVYPQEAARQGQSGQGELRFVLRKDGSVRTVEIVSSSGVRVLDRYIEFAIRQAEPFPPIPASVGEDVIPISINFTYTLHGFRLFGFQ